MTEICGGADGGVFGNSDRRFGGIGYAAGEGDITAPSKAPIADAKIAAVSAATNFRHETTTNASGEYYLTSFPPGLYRIEIEKTGFKRLIKPDVILHGQDALAIDL